MQLLAFPEGSGHNMPARAAQVLGFGLARKITNRSRSESGRPSPRALEPNSTTRWGAGSVPARAAATSPSRLLSGSDESGVKCAAPRCPAASADPDDDTYILCARQTGAVVISGDSDLLHANGWEGSSMEGSSRA